MASNIGILGLEVYFPTTYVDQQELGATPLLSFAAQPPSSAVLGRTSRQTWECDPGDAFSGRIQ